VQRAVRITGWIGLVCSVAAILGLGAVLMTHPRNEQSYLAYVSTYGDYRGRPVAALPPSATLVAAGDRACAWLDHQPVALWRTGSSWRVSSLFGRYKHAISAADAALPRSVVPGAWAYLCPASLYLHKPHYVFGSPGD
jgi:hypothetical protein